MTEIKELSIKSIITGDNDRTVFDPAGLEELAESIREHGLAQPITVRPLQSGTFQIVAGERRFRAMSVILKLDTVPCIIREMGDEEASAIMLAENIGRKDLDPVDESLAYKRRVDQFGWEPAEIARRCGVSVERIKRRLKLVSVRQDILQLVRSGQFPVGHAEAISVLDPNRQMIAARPLINGQAITFRQFKALVDQLYEEQSQESIFDLALFGGQIPDQPQVEVTRILIPTAEDLPPVTIPDERTTGAIIYHYIQDLISVGKQREAEVVGTVLAGLCKSNYARIPVIARKP